MNNAKNNRIISLVQYALALLIIFLHITSKFKKREISDYSCNKNKFLEKIQILKEETYFKKSPN